MVLGIATNGQTPFFSSENIAPEALNPEQRVIYDKAVNFGTYNGFQIGHVNPISSCLYQDSFLNVQANGLACHNTAQSYEHLSKGVNKLALDVSNLASGLYQLVLIKEGFKEVKSVTIQH